MLHIQLTVCVVNSCEATGSEIYLEQKYACDKKARHCSVQYMKNTGTVWMNRCTEQCTVFISSHVYGN